MEFLEHLEKTGLIFDDDMPAIIANEYFLKGKTLNDLETDLYGLYSNEETAETVFENISDILEESKNTVKQQLRARQVQAIEADIISWEDDPDDDFFIKVQMSYGIIRIVKSSFADGFYNLSKYNIARYIYQCM